MLKRDYDEKDTANTGSHLSVDEKIRQSDSDRISYEEGFASESGVRPETASSGGRIRHPEDKDAAIVNTPADFLDDETLDDYADPVKQTESL